MQVIRGNFPVKNPVMVEEKDKTLEQQFEAAALKRLGGSIAYVAKQKVIWANPVEEQFKK